MGINPAEHGSDGARRSAFARRPVPPDTATIAITGATRKRAKTTVSTGSLRIAITVNQTVAANTS